jgi:hypothetical protein
MRPPFASLPLREVGEARIFRPTASRWNPRGTINFINFPLGGIQHRQLWAAPTSSTQKLTIADCPWQSLSLARRFMLSLAVRVRAG